MNQNPEKKKVRRKIFFNTVFPVLLTVLLFILTFFIIVMPSIEEHLLNHKKNMAEEMTQAVMSLINQYHERVLAEELTLKEAQKRVLNRIESMKYGQLKKDYFWVHNVDMKMLMHPYRKDLVSKNVKNFQDTSGHYLFQDMGQIIRENGGGFVEYYWQKQDDSSHIESKISYIDLFKPWNWIIGTGIYQDNIKKEIEEITNESIRIFVFILSLILLISLYIIIYSKKTEEQKSYFESKLRINEQKFSLLVDTMNEGFIIIDEKQMIVYANKTCCEQMGYTLEELKQKEIADLLVKENRSVWANEFAKRKKGIVDTYEMVWVRKDGNQLQTLISPKAIFDEQNHFKGSFAVITDITRLKKAEQEILEAKNIAEEANHLRGQFIHNMSHEFRSPVNGIIGMVRLLNRTELNEEQKNFVSNIELCSNNLLQYINNILEYSRIRSGKLKLSQEHVNLNDLLNNIIKIAQIKIGNKDISIDYSISKEVSSNLSGDTLKIQQLVINLMENALKYTLQGKVEINIDLMEDFSDYQKIKIMVKDTGIGIPQEQIEQIFESFHQVEGEHSSQKSGVGLGLSIVKGFVDLMRGKIEVQSRVGQGSVFTVYLELKKIS